MTQASPISAEEFERHAGPDGWRVLSDGACAYFRTDSFAASARFVAALGGADELAGHPPAVDIRSDGVTVRVITVEDEYFGMSQRDLEAARAVSAVASTQHLVADPSALQSFLVIPGAPAGESITPFWQALLGYEPRPDSPEEDLVDPHDRGPAFWFEGMDEPRGDGGGAIHVAVWLPRERAEERVAAAVAAGGRIVRDMAPAWWTLVDPAGNEADVASVAGRD